MFRKRIRLFFMLSLLLTVLCLPFLLKEDSAFDVVKRYIESLDHNNLNAIPDIWVKGHEVDVYDIKKAQIVRWKEVPYQYVQNFVPIRYMERFNDSNPKAFYVAADYRVGKETKHHINGVNYFLAVVVREGGRWKIALTSKPPITSVITDGYGFGTEDEKTFDDRRLTRVFSRE